MELAILNIATIDTINAAGLTKLTKFKITLCKNGPISGNVPNGVALVAIKTIDASKNGIMSLSSIFKKPINIPRINNRTETQETPVNDGKIAKTIENKIPIKKA